MTTLYYKYRKTSNLQRLLDILLRQRLYASEYKKLNDPMEGKFLYSGCSKDFKQRIKDKLENMFICSLSTSYNNGLMWTHYADEHKGCCIEFEVTAKSWKQQEINYPSTLPNIDDYSNQSDEDIVDSILFQKSADWKYEHEIRYIKEKRKKTTPYLKIRITRLLLGLNIRKEEAQLLKELVDIMNEGKKKDKKIEVYKMKERDIDFGYNQ